MRAIRGKEISMIFQEPMTALNPVYTCGEQIIEALVLHEKMTRAQARTRAIEMLERVGIPAAAQRVDEYPHQLSGGMRQRVMIAMALACRPAVLIADEPTTALDVTIQAQILELLKELQREMGMAVILITHDLGVVAETARSRRGDVRRTGRRVCRRAVRVPAAASSVHRRAAVVAAEAWRSRRSAARDSRHRSESRRAFRPAAGFIRDAR